MKQNTKRNTNIHDTHFKMVHKNTKPFNLFIVFRIYDEDNEECIKQCQVLLEESNINMAVRIGDIYAFLVEHFAKKEKWKAVS